MKIPRRRHRPITETQMVSLADIAFLIIFFFMLTSTFMRDKMGVKLPVLARSDQSEAGIVVILDKQKQIFLDGKPVGSADALERELKGLLADKRTARDAQVRFRCDKSMPYSEYKPIYRAISRAGGVIAIMHELPRG